MQQQLPFRQFQKPVRQAEARCRTVEDDTLDSDRALLRGSAQSGVILAVDVEDDEGRAAGVMLLRLAEKGLQDRGDRAGFTAAGIAQDRDMTAEELVQTNFDVVVLEHHRLADR